MSGGIGQIVHRSGKRQSGNLAVSVKLDSDHTLIHRYPGTLVDFNPALTNPQLQQYNPGRTLTDYVTQIDALQRRLGTTLQSGAGFYHFSVVAMLDPPISLIP